MCVACAKEEKGDIALAVQFITDFQKLRRQAIKVSRCMCAEVSIDHLQVRTKECINMLIVVTSQLDALVPSISVLNPMENCCCGRFKCML